MAVIAPFRGLRYNPAKIEKMAEVVTPPYDVIDERGRELLLKKNPYNMIQLDLSKSVRPETMTDARYRQARELLEKWLADEILIRDAAPQLYIYNIEYTHPTGRRLTRKGFVCLTRLAEFAEGIVKPHEKTFKGVITDRVRLLDACRTQFSKVFSLFPDPEGLVMTALESAAPEVPMYQVQDQDGCLHTISPVADPAVIGRVQQMFAEKSVYIADGHHRYTTSLEMREIVRKEPGGLAEDSPFNHIMMYLCPMEDPGLSVLPTHRKLRLDEIAAEELVARLAVSFDIEEMHSGSREVLMAEVLGRMDEEKARPGVIGLYHPAEDRCFLLIMKKDAIDKAAGAAGLDDSLKELDVVVLSELIFDHLLGLGHDRCENEGLVEYFSDPDEALDAAVKESVDKAITPALFLLNHTRVAQVKNVADQGLVMPHKSTFFYPKILTGLLLNRLVAGEKIS